PRKSSASGRIRDAFLKSANKNEAPQLADLADMADSQKPGVFRRQALPTCKNPPKMRDDHGTARPTKRPVANRLPRAPPATRFAGGTDAVESLDQRNQVRIRTSGTHGNMLTPRTVEQPAELLAF